MEKIIKLTQNNIARLTDSKPFYLPDNFQIIFESNYSLTTAFVSLKNGEMTGILPLTKPFNIPEKFLFAGDLNIAVKLYHDGKVAKEWFVLPIKIVETEFGINAFDMLSALEEKVNAIESKMVTKEEHNTLTLAHNKLAESHNELTETVKDIKENF